MPFKAVAVDYDGTLTLGARPSPEVLEALRSTREQGHRLVLVTGRRLSDLRHVLPDVDERFDAIVAENGGVLVIGGVARPLATPTDPALEDALTRRGVPVQAGDVLLACDAVHAVTVLEEVQRLGLDSQIIRNRGALMVLPAGVGKGSGVASALAELGISTHAAIGIGDAENDHALLRDCELGVATGNAIASLKAQADLVLPEPDGAGVAAFLRGPVLAGTQRVFSGRRNLVVGTYDDGSPATIPASSLNVLIVGGSGTGKSTTAGLLIEQLVRLRYGVLVVDQEGDHTGLASIPDVITIHPTGDPPPPADVVALLQAVNASVIVDLSTCGAGDYLDRLLAEVERARRTHRVPQWLFVEEAHRAPPLPSTQRAVPSGLGSCLVTWRPEQLDQATVDAVDVAIVFPDPTNAEPLEAVVTAVGGVEPATARALLGAVGLGQAVLATRVVEQRAGVVELADRATPHVRHARKYADAPLPVHLRFVFRRPGGEPTGRVAANLHDLHDVVAECAPEVIDHHLSERDLSRWALGSLQDLDLANAFAEIEEAGLPLEEARRRVLAAVQDRYLRR